MSAHHELPLCQDSGFGGSTGKSLARLSGAHAAFGGNDKCEYRILKGCTSVARPCLTHQAFRCILQRVHNSDPAELPEVDANGRLENDPFHVGENVRWTGRFRQITRASVCGTGRKQNASLNRCIDERLPSLVGSDVPFVNTDQREGCHFPHRPFRPSPAKQMLCRFLHCRHTVDCGGSAERNMNRWLKGGLLHGRANVWATALFRRNSQ